MNSFKKFFFSNSSKGMLPSPEQSENKISNVILALVGTGIGSVTNPNEKQKFEFSTSVSKLAHSEKFIGELSDKIGIPKPGESEDDFAKRSKNAMKALLREKMKR